MLCMSLVTCRAGKIIPRVDPVQMIDRCRQDQTLPILTTLSSFGIAKYRYLGQIAPRIVKLRLERKDDMQKYAVGTTAVE